MIWTEPSPIAMQGRAPGRKSPRANTAAITSGTTEARIFKRNMTRTRPPISPRNAAAYGWQSVKETSYRRVDGGGGVLKRICRPGLEPGPITTDVSGEKDWGSSLA